MKSKISFQLIWIRKIQRNGALQTEGIISK